MPLHAQAQIIYLVDIVGRKLPDEKPAARTSHQQPLALEKARGLPHRRPADAQFPGNPGFDHLGTWRQPSLNNGAHQHACDLADEICLGESRQTNRRRHTAH